MSRFNAVRVESYKNADERIEELEHMFYSFLHRSQREDHNEALAALMESCWLAGYNDAADDYGD